MALKELIDNPIKSEDFYVLNPPHQPKQEIAKYMESERILVPYRFADLHEALSSGKPFIVRSEHPQDYSEISNLLSSFQITPEWINEARQKYGSQPQEIDWNQVVYANNLVYGIQAVDKTIAQLGTITQQEFENNLKYVSGRRISEYCSLLRINPKEFFSKISYSYWELLGGYNRTVVADSAVPDRYHIFTTIPGDEFKHGYAILENGEVTTNISSKLPSGFDLDFPSLVAFYESIRNLSRFDKTHCPIVEAQTVKGRHYFLQYHRAADSNPSRFMLVRNPEKDEIKAMFVRGATPRKGITVSVNIHDKNRNTLQQEEGGLDLGVSRIFTELMLRKRRIHLFGSDSVEEVVQDLSDSHLPKSRLFKPQISIALKREDIDSLLKGVCMSGNSVPQVQLWIVSDGRTAFIKKIE